jgi:hypothetical protein
MGIASLSNRRIPASPLLAAALAVCLGVPARAQTLPPSPVPVAAPAGTPGPAAPPPFTGLTPPPPPMPPPTDPGPLVYHDPLPSHDALLAGTTAPPGWFGAVEFGVVKPHVKNRLDGSVSFGDQFDDPVHLPGAHLDWAVAPRFDLGYRLGDGLGEFVVSYRFLSSEGRTTLTNFDLFSDSGDAWLRSRLDVNVLDFDYGNCIALGTRCDLNWRAGVRLASVYFDSLALGEVTEQRVSNRFVGAGPHAGLDLWYHFSLPGLGVFARVDGALLIGSTHQSFEETFVFSDGEFGSASTRNSTRTVPMIDAQLGVGWAPPGSRLRFTAGYEYEHWWAVGNAGGSHAELFDQGAFFRAEFNF